MAHWIPGGAAAELRGRILLGRGRTRFGPTTPDKILAFVSNLWPAASGSDPSRPWCGVPRKVWQGIRPPHPCRLARCKRRDSPPSPPRGRGRENQLSPRPLGGKGWGEACPYDTDCQTLSGTPRWRCRGSRRSVGLLPAQAAAAGPTVLFAEVTRGNCAAAGWPIRRAHARLHRCSALSPRARAGTGGHRNFPSPRTNSSATPGISPA